MDFEKYTVVCGLKVYKGHIKWQNITISCDSDISDFLKFINGKIFVGYNEKALMRLSGKYDKFDILAYDSNDALLLSPICVNRRLPVPSKNYFRTGVAIIKSKNLREFLELNYVPLGKEYKNNPCKENLDEWVFSGRLAAFQTEFIRIAIRELSVQELNYVEGDLSEQFALVPKHQWSMVGTENAIDSLKRLITFGLNALDNLETNGHVIPEEYDLRSFLENKLSKRQRTSSSSSEIPFVNPLNE